MVLMECYFFLVMLFVVSFFYVERKIELCFIYVLIILFIFGIILLRVWRKYYCFRGILFFNYLSFFVICGYLGF